MKNSLFFISLFTSTILFAVECKKDPSYRVELRHRDPQGVGYNEGYTTAEFFLPISPVSWSTIFLDLQAHVFNNGRWAGNVGVGARKPFGNFLTGLNIYYDYRDIADLGGQNRIGAGGEFLTKWADLRINGYAPIGDTKFAGSKTFSHFHGYSAFGKQKIAATLPSIDLEIGAPILGSFQDANLYTALGTYYLFEREVDGFKLEDAWGVRGRVDLWIYDGIRIGADITYDRIFQTRVQGLIGFSLPLGPVNMRTRGKQFKENYAHCEEKALEERRKLQPVYRQEIIPSESECVQFRIVPTGRCGESFLPPNFNPPEFPGRPNPPGFTPSGEIIFVDNRSSAGDGTFEFPYPTLLDAETNSIPGDIIYVFFGNGTSNGMNDGIVLQENQALIGSGIPFELGGIIIPPFDPDRKPLITNDLRQNGGAFFGVQLQSRDIVAGFLFDGTPSSGNLVACDATNSNNFIFSSNEVVNTNQSVLTKNGSISDGRIILFNNVFDSIPKTILFTGSVNSSAIGIIGNTFITPVGPDAVIDLFGSSPGNATNSIIQVADNFFEESGIVDISSTFNSLTNSLLVIDGNLSTKLGTNVPAFIVNTTGGIINFSNNETINTGNALSPPSAETFTTNGSMCATGNNFDNGWELTLTSNSGFISCLRLVDNNSGENDLNIFAADPSQIESPDGDQLPFTGLQNLNPDAVINIFSFPEDPPIPVPENTCNCS